MIVDFLKSLSKKDCKKLLVIAITIFFCILVDQTSKLVVQNTINYGSKISFLPFFNIVNLQNKGIGLGFFGGFSHSNNAFIFINSSIVFLLLCFTITNLKNNHLANCAAKGAVIGGATANILDRISKDGVVDFIDFYILGLHLPVFNLADAFIFCGIFFIFLSEISQGNNPY